MDFGDAPAPAEGSNPFDAGFDAPAAPQGEAVVESVAFETFAEPAAPASAGGAPAAAAAAPLDDAFFGGGGAAESNGGADAPAAAQAEAVFAAPTFADPRIEWDHKNQAVLAKRAADEAASKKELLSSAKAFLDKQAKEREVLLSKRKSTNRELEKTSNVAAGAVPSGDKPWDRVLSVITFNREDAKGPHVAKDTFKELSRFKGVLLAAKAANVPVSA